MPATYSIVVQNPYGVSHDVWTRFDSLSYNRTFNRKGALTITLPDIIEPGEIYRDFRLLVYRSIDGSPAYLDTEAFWLVRQVIYESDKRQWTIKADDPLSILERRIVAYTPITPYADKTYERFDYDGLGIPPVADDMIKMYVTENIGSDTLDFVTGVSPDPARDLSAYINFEAWEGEGAIVEKQAGWQNLLSVVSDIANQSAQSGAPIYFDIIVRPDGSLHFMTFTNLRGTDRGALSSAPLSFYPDSNIEDLTVTWDYSKEINYIYAGGIDPDDSRLLEQNGDTQRILGSPWNRNEMFLDLGSEASDTGYMQAEIGEALYAGRPKLIIEGSPIDGPGYQYGVDYFYGDVVVCNVLGYSIDSTIDSVTISVNNGKEKVNTRLRGEITL